MFIYNFTLLPAPFFHLLFFPSSHFDHPALTQFLLPLHLFTQRTHWHSLKCTAGWERENQYHHLNTASIFNQRLRGLSLQTHQSHQPLKHEIRHKHTWSGSQFARCNLQKKMFKTSFLKVNLWILYACSRATVHVMLKGFPVVNNLTIIQCFSGIHSFCCFSLMNHNSALITLYFLTRTEREKGTQWTTGRGTSKYQDWETSIACSQMRTGSSRMLVRKRCMWHRPLKRKN